MHKKCDGETTKGSGTVPSVLSVMFGVFMLLLFIVPNYHVIERAEQDAEESALLCGFVSRYAFTALAVCFMITVLLKK